jgi:hypothetical protein
MAHHPLVVHGHMLLTVRHQHQALPSQRQVGVDQHRSPAASGRPACRRLLRASARSTASYCVHGVACTRTFLSQRPVASARASGLFGKAIYKRVYRYPKVTRKVALRQATALRHASSLASCCSDVCDLCCQRADLSSAQVSQSQRCVALNRHHASCYIGSKKPSRLACRATRSALYGLEGCPDTATRKPVSCSRNFQVCSGKAHGHQYRGACHKEMGLFRCQVQKRGPNKHPKKPSRHCGCISMLT